MLKTDTKLSTVVSLPSACDTSGADDDSTYNSSDELSKTVAEPLTKTKSTPPMVTSWLAYSPAPIVKVPLANEAHIFVPPLDTLAEA